MEREPIEDRIREVNAQVERQTLAEQERGRRAAEAEAKAHEAELDRQRKDLKRLTSDRSAAYKQLERDLSTVVGSIRNAIDLAAQVADAEHRLHRAEGDENASSNGFYASPVINRLLAVLHDDARISDIRSLPYPLGRTPLTDEVGK